MIGRAVDIDRYFLELADVAISDQLAGKPEKFVRALHAAGLEDLSVTPGRGNHRPCFADAVRKRLLAVNVLSRPARLRPRG